MSIDLRHLCDFSIDFDPIQYIPTAAGMRANHVIKEGVVTGERFNGEFIRGGGDWILVGGDQIARLDVRATIRADDGELVFVTNTGRVDLRDGIGERLLAGESLTWRDFYARSSPLFETGSEKYAWLNSVVTVALNGLTPAHVDYEIYEVA
jgi:Protein of unknown function (DUF3237)